MLTNMKGALSADPVLRTVPDPHSGNNMKVADVFIIYQKDADSAQTKVRCVAWNEMAEKVAGMKKGDEIEFAGNLTYNNYQNATMDKPRKVLGFTIMALDESRTLCQKMEQFMDVQRRPEEKAGAIFQPMRGKLLADPELNEIKGHDGQPLAACRATLRYWNGKRGNADILVPITAYGEAAQQLAEMKKGDPIQFVGRLDSHVYTNDKMDYGHMELCYNVVSIDKERNLVRNTDAFLREETGMKARPLQDKIQNAEARTTAAQPTNDAPAKEVAEPVK